MDADTIIDRLAELVTQPNAADPESHQILAAALISRLKAVNRASNQTTRLIKDGTTAARQEMDQSHLGLQNLLYEKRHLEREIEKCRQFASIYQDVPLYTLEEFNVIAPKEARTPDALSNEHQLMLNRLSFELVERQRLDKRKKDLTHDKEELLKESKSKQTTLENIKNHIEKLRQVATDIQKKVDDLVSPIPLLESTTLVEDSARNTPS